MANFNTYDIFDSVYDLADGLLPEIAEAAEFELTPVPSAQNLGDFIGRLGPSKELQKNIEIVESNLGSDSTQKIGDWIERSGIMLPTARPFITYGTLPEKFDAAVLTGGVANWMLRRVAQLERIDPERIEGSVTLAIGQRQMKPIEHQLVESYLKREGKLPTETEFAKTYLLGRIATAGFTPELIAVDSTNGDEVLDQLFAQKSNTDLASAKLLIVSNAPNAIQAAGQLRLAGKSVDEGYDSNGDQVSVIADTFPIARSGESPATHQNPKTALGQLLRNAKYIVENQQTSI